ncbi:hypothetical protein D9M72_617320 [compost metagenome]
MEQRARHGAENEKALLDGRARKWIQKTRLNGRVLEGRHAAFTATHAAIKTDLFRAEKCFIVKVCMLANGIGVAE